MECRETRWAWGGARIPKKLVLSDWYYGTWNYRGADTSLARPGRKQAKTTILLQTTQKKNSEVFPTRSPRQQWPPRRRKNGELSIVFFSRVGLKTYQHPCTVAENVVLWLPVWKMQNVWSYTEFQVRNYSCLKLVHAYIYIYISFLSLLISWPVPTHFTPSQTFVSLLKF